ncbi:hypothetical protein G7Y89_g7792 [Cudoniella acicularis]|uniref:Uncharacterized protein n=1 Tax=Cudoniella acicularis TaxID=354080 RepID=A0A8H4RKK0_9HELO|nr:hypothetical protein G7Y89_g7792 [Cudoniella acicularis]
MFSTSSPKRTGLETTSSRVPVNLTVLMVLKGEPGWICLMCCNVDILFSVLVLHWITSKDNASTLRNLSLVVPNPSHSVNHPSTPSRPLPRGVSEVSAYELGLSEYLKKGGVTTLVTASKDRDDEMEGIKSMPPNVITVESRCVREVEEVDIVGRDRDIEKEVGLGKESEEGLFSMDL